MMVDSSILIGASSANTHHTGAAGQRNSSLLTHSKAGGDVGELRQLACHRVDLDAKLSRWHQHQHTRHLGLLGLVDESLQHWQHERGSLT